jgi:hypothetical protein
MDVLIGFLVSFLVSFLFGFLHGSSGSTTLLFGVQSPHFVSFHTSDMRLLNRYTPRRCKLPPYPSTAPPPSRRTRRTSLAFFCVGPPSVCNTAHRVMLPNGGMRSPFGRGCIIVNFCPLGSCHSTIFSGCLKERAK